jgi:glycopeptide antibiotics resistance protein
MPFSSLNKETKMSFFGLRFREASYKLLLFFLIALFEGILFYLTRHVQYEVRAIKTNWLIDSIPSFNLALGLPFALWIISKFTFRKTLIIGLSITLTHELLRYIDDGIPIDPFDILFSLFGGLCSVLVYVCLIKIFSRK